MFTKERSSGTLLGIVILSLFAASCLISSCTGYNPSLYPSYDVLNPGPEVRANPIGWVENGKVVDDDGKEVSVEKGVVVNEAYVLWVYELQEEIKKLRRK